MTASNNNASAMFPAFIEAIVPFPNLPIAQDQRTRVEKDSRPMVTISSASAESASDQ